MLKTFKNDFNKLLNKLKNGENFSFIRFSDGEMFCLQNKKLQLNQYGTFLDDQLIGPIYTPEDYKEFLPNEHQEFYNKLHESLKYQSENYYVGLSCPCCVGIKHFKEMIQMRGCDDAETTWANLFVNSNYPLFVQQFIPELKKRGIILICNQNADLSKSQLNILKDFRIGQNAMINDFNLHKQIGAYIENNNIKNQIFCFAASSLTNITVYELVKKYPENIYLDIGTTLNPILGLPITRDYLRAFWTNQPHQDLFKTCIWM